MIKYRFRVSHGWPGSRSNEALGGNPGGYDFHAYCLDSRDVIWAWALVVGVLLLLAFTL